MTLVKNLTIVTMNQRREIIEDGALEFTDDQISAIGKSADFPDRSDAIDGTGMVALPGLIDTHSHADQSLLRGLGDQMHWVPFLQKVVDPYLAKRSTTHSVLSNTLSMVEMIKSGTTAFVSPNTDPRDTMSALAQASAKVGIRSIFCRFTTAQDDWASLVARFEDWSSSGSSLVDVWFGLDIPRVMGDRAHPDFYRRVKEQSERLGVGIVYHFCSEFEDAAFMVNEFGMTPAEWSRANHVLGNNVILINGCQMTTQEIDILAETETHLSHSPVANMKMATGILPASDVLHAGVNVGLGTDGALNNNSYDMFFEMKCACLLQNSTKRSARALLPEQALEMATVNGARAIGRDDLGSLEVGKQADCILVDMASARTKPIHDVVSNLVFSASASQVRYVFIAGRQVVKNYVVQGLSEPDLLAQADAVADEIKAITAEKRESLWPKI